MLSYVRYVFATYPIALASTNDVFGASEFIEALCRWFAGIRRKNRSLSSQAVVCLLAIVPMACSPLANMPRETARATVLTIAEGVRQADITCAELASVKKDANLSGTCASAYDAARDALLGAEAAIDAWNAGRSGDVACASAAAVTGLSSMASAIRGRGGKVPLVVEDALSLASALTEDCHG